MLFNRLQRDTLCWVFMVVVLLGVSVLVGCEEDVIKQDDVFDDAAGRVETSLLPIMVDESEGVLRNLLNLLAALPEICSTSLATLGSFVSSLPALGSPVTSTWDDDEGSWEIVWRNVVLGDNIPPLTVDTNTPRVDITLTVNFLSGGFGSLRAVPFSLVSPTTLQTAGEPASFAHEGFFLYQNASTGEWTLRWRALGATKVFEGSVNTGVARVVRHLPDGNDVTSLEVNTGSSGIRFEESTAATDNKGFTFFVRPGEIIRFQLRIGPDVGALQSITRDQFRLGPNAEPLPADKNPDNFTLASNLPTDPRGRPAFTAGEKVGTFIWQDTENNGCNTTTEDQWRIRFSSIPGSTKTFSGTATALEDNNASRLRATAVGSCPTESIEQGGRELNYDCLVQGNTENGYDVCVTRERRVAFSPEVDEVRDPGKVFIGSQGAAPPSPYPFAVLFDFEITEQLSSRNLGFSDTAILLRGNNDAEGAIPLNPDQVSLDPFCSIPGETKQRLPRVRLTGKGEYSTQRFEGSRYELNDDEDVQDNGIEFTEVIDANDNDNPLSDSRRFPDRGNLLLQTRLEGELENTEIAARMQEIEDINAKTVVPVDVNINVSGIVFGFPDQEVTLEVE